MTAEGKCVDCGLKVAALFVDPRGSYAGLPDVDLWDEARDARLYDGPWPVVAHPPCSRWCRLAGLVEARWGHKRGDDGGCFASALESVRVSWCGNRTKRTPDRPRVGKKQASKTPLEFRDVLLNMARSVRKVVQQ